MWLEWFCLIVGGAGIIVNAVFILVPSDDMGCSGRLLHGIGICGGIVAVWYGASHLFPQYF